MLPQANKQNKFIQWKSSHSYPTQQNRTYPNLTQPNKTQHNLIQGNENLFFFYSLQFEKHQCRDMDIQAHVSSQEALYMLSGSYPDAT